MYTFEQAKVLDGMVKKVSKRLFIKYWPAYRDIQGHLALPKTELWLSNPDDPDQAELVYRHLPLTPFDQPEQCLMDQTHIQAVQEAVKAFKRAPAKQFLNASSVKTERDYQPFRVDQRDSGDNMPNSYYEDGAQDTVNYEVLMAHLPDRSLNKIWYRALTVDQRSPYQMSSGRVDQFSVLSTDLGEEDFNRFFDDSAAIRTQDYDVRSQEVVKARDNGDSPLSAYHLGDGFSLTAPEVITAGSPYLKARLKEHWVYIMREEDMLPKETAVRSYRILITDAPKLAEQWDFPKRLRAQGFSYKTNAEGEFVIGSDQLNRTGFWPHNPFDRSRPAPVPGL